MTTQKKVKYKTNGELEMIYLDKRPKFILRFIDDNQKKKVYKAAKDKNISINKIVIEALERYLN